MPQAVAGVAAPGTRPCNPSAEDAARPPSTPTGAPVITVDDRVSSWIPNGHTAPLGLLGTTTVTVARQGSGRVILSVYGSGIGDDHLSGDQAAVRATLTATIDRIVDGTSAEGPWTPNRLQVTRFERAESGTMLSWPLAAPIAEVLERRTDRRLPCGVVDDRDAAAVAAVLDGGPALSLWADGSDRATLAIGVLVPGQLSCAG